jgi:hypothetical protein
LFIRNVKCEFLKKDKEWVWNQLTIDTGLYLYSCHTNLSKTDKQDSPIKPVIVLKLLNQPSYRKTKLLPIIYRSIQKLKTSINQAP